MAERIVLNESTMSAIGDAIRDKNGETDTYLPSEMPKAIRGIPSVDTNFYLYYASGTSIYDINGTDVPSKCFQDDISLLGASWNSCTRVHDSSFQECSSLLNVFLPSCSRIGYWAFYSCISLHTVVLPLCQSFDAGAFFRCYSLEVVSFPACTTLRDDVFLYCSNLKSVFFLGSSLISFVSRMEVTSVFYGTHESLSIYVPASLLSQYQVASYWSSMSSRLVGV